MLSSTMYGHCVEFDFRIRRSAQCEIFYAMFVQFFLQNPENTPLMVVTAHNWMTSGFYKTAVGEYMVAHKKVRWFFKYYQIRIGR